LPVAVRGISVSATKRIDCGIGGADGKHGLYEYMETQVV
jgi:hypothetical protein